MKETTESLMTNPAKVEFFRKFLESESSNSEILFYMDIENFKQHLPTEGHLTQSDCLKAQAIYSKYIKKAAPFKVKLSAGAVKGVKKGFKDWKKEREQGGPVGKGLPRTLFDEMQMEIIALIEQEQLPRFMKSMFYITMYNAMVNRTPYELPDQVGIRCH